MLELVLERGLGLELVLELVLVLVLGRERGLGLELALVLELEQELEPELLHHRVFGMWLRQYFGRSEEQPQREPFDSTDRSRLELLVGRTERIEVRCCTRTDLG